MDSLFIVLVFATVISTAYTQKPVVNPFQITENDESEDIENVPIYPGLSEVAGPPGPPYFNPRLYRPPAYDYRNIITYPSRRSLRYPYDHKYSHPMYMNPHPRIPPKWASPYQVPVRPPIAFWIPKLNSDQIPNKQDSKNNTKNSTTTEAVRKTTAPITTTTTTAAATKTTTPITTTPIATTTLAPESVTEVTTQIVEIETTEAPKQQAEELSEEPNRRLLTAKKDENYCGPYQESTEAPATEANEEQPSMTTVVASQPDPVVPQVTTEKVPASSSEAAISSTELTISFTQAADSSTQPPASSTPAAATSTQTAASSTQAAASSTEASSSEEEAISLATLRRSDMPVFPESTLSQLYPGKSLYPAPYHPMPYFPEMPIDPYAALYRMGHHQMFPRVPERYYGF